MKKISRNRVIQCAVFAATIIFTTSCYSADCNCVDWVNKGGYCVDYVKDKVPSFPIPQDRTEITSLKNKDLFEVEKGDVAIFSLRNYWHVAYVEKVHLDKHGVASAIDVSEMNSSGQLSLDEFQDRWGIRSKSEWKRALCCGVTENYGLASTRHNVPLNTVKQLWSSNADDSGDKKFVGIIADKVREVINRLFLFSDKYI